MSEETIYLKDVLETMKTLDENGKAIYFSISFRTYNRYSKTGGKLIRYPKAKLVIKEEFKKDNSIKSLRIKPKRRTNIKKNPNHFENKTRNIKLPSGEIRKLHIRYIIEFNGKKVIY